MHPNTKTSQFIHSVLLPIFFKAHTMLVHLPLSDPTQFPTPFSLKIPNHRAEMVEKGSN